MAKDAAPRMSEGEMRSVMENDVGRVTKDYKASTTQSARDLCLHPRALHVGKHTFAAAGS